VKALALVALAACSDPDYMSLPTTTSVGGSCNGLLTVEASEPATHVDMGTTLAWSNNPPTSGPHYPVWAAWDRQYAQLPRGNYVHNAEHGGVILLYRCDPDCPDVVASLLDVARAMPADSKCSAPVTKRVIVTADPLLPDGVQVAAVSWEHAYTASCFDDYVATFAAEHYAKGPEDVCADGANLGGTLITP
jgi:hypothetical protein